jgi:hypothetical protein
MREGRSRARLYMRLALDGLAQRIATITTAWTMTAVLAATTLGGLARLGSRCRKCAPGFPANHPHRRAGTAHAPDATPPAPIQSHLTPVGDYRATTHRSAILTALTTPSVR